MRIESLHMDGFGHFHDTGIETLPAGAVIIAGPNEAGKSTVLGFIKFVLFGFPPKHQRIYPPLDGGRHGGRLVLRTPEGETFTVERIRDRKNLVRILSADGSTRSEEPSSVLFPGVTRELFGHIHAIGLDDLNSIQPLQDKALRSALHGAASGASAGALVEVRGRLGKRTDELFKPTGANPTINRLLSDLQSVRQQLVAAQGELAEYNTLLGRSNELTREIDEATQRRRDASVLLHRWGTTSNGWGDWVTLAGVEEQLRQLDVSGFPEDGSERLELLLALVEDRRRALERAEVELADARSELLEVTVDEAVLDSAPVITDLANRRAEFAAARQSRDAITRRCDELESTIAVDLGRLGSEWSVERACGIDRSLFTLETVNRFSIDIEDGRHELGRATVARDAAAREVDRAERAESDAARQLEAISDNTGTVPDDAVVGRLRSLRADLSHPIRTIPGLEARIAELGRRIEGGLAALGTGWTMDLVLAMDTSGPVRETIARMSNALAAAQDSVSDAKRAFAEATENFDEQSAERHRITDAGPRVGPDADSIERRRAAVRALRSVVITAGTLRGRIEARASERRPRGVGLATAGLVLLSLGGLAGIGLAVTGRIVEAAIIAAVLIATGFVLFWLARLERGRDDSAGREAETRELHSLEQRITNQWVELGGAGSPTFDELDRFERGLDLEARSAAEAERARERLESADARLEEAGRRRVKAEKALEAAATAERRHLESWREWRELTRIPGDTSPQAFLGMFGPIDVIRDAFRDRAEQIRQRDEILREIDAAHSFLGSIPALFERAAGRPLDEQLVEVDRLLHEVDRLRDLARDRAGLARTVNTLANQTEGARKVLAAAETAWSRAFDAVASTEENWSAWLAGAGLPDGLLPATARTALETIGRIVDAGLDSERVRSDLGSSCETIDAYLVEVRSVVGCLGRNLEVTEQSAGAVVDTLAREVAEARTALELRHRSQSRLAQADSTVASEKERLVQREAELDALLREAGAESVPAFRQKAKAFADRARLLTEVARCVGVLRTVSGCGTVEEVRAIYETLTPDVMATEIERVSAVVAGADAKLDELVKERADTDARLGQLRTAESVANARSVEESLLAQLRSAARDWMRHAVAGHLLDISQRRFEAERQPAVIKAASRYFATITSDRYDRVVAPLDSSMIEVVAPDGRRTESSNLSRGTLEQLYLAIRFGYVESSEADVTMPLVFDDLLVNADPERMVACARAILDLSVLTQVLYFTCHPETVEAFRRADPAVPVISIAGCRFESGMPS